MKVLVTGGAGLIGAHLTRRLLSRGDEVVLLDNFSSGSRANVAALDGTSGFSSLEHDVIVPFEIDCDLIYNLACPASPPSYQSAPIETVKTSVLGAINVLDLARRNGATVVQASTSEIYGDPEVHPQPESYSGNVNPLGPRACYDEGKRCAETLFADYRRVHDLSVRIARIFNTYGPMMRADDGRVVSNFIVQALNGKPITLHGDGSQTRSLCYVADTVEALLRLPDAPDEEWTPVNIGNPAEITVREIAETVKALTGSASPIVTTPRPVDDPERRRPDIKRAGAVLDWRPQTDLRDGLSATIEWFDAQLSSATDRPAYASS